MPHYPRLSPSLVVIVSFFSAVAIPAGAQEVPWRLDYRVARQEAWRQQRPILIDCGTTDCFWCRKLESTTFRDPRVAGLIGGEFVALKVNADRNPWLAEALHIQSYPTLVLAGPDGRILNVLEGYQDADTLARHLSRVVKALGGPAQLRQHYQDAAAALAARDNGRAIALLKRLVSGGTTYPVQVRAKQVLAGLEQRASERLSRAAQLQAAGQHSEAADIFTEVVRTYPGTPAARQAEQMLAAGGKDIPASHRP